MELSSLKLIGVGDGGCKAINRLAPGLALSAHLWAINTDAQALADARTSFRLEIGTQTTRGLSAGGLPTVGERAAEESRTVLAAAVAGAHIVVLLAGMGGGTGTGATPVLAGLAREAGAVVIAVVTMPFTFEGRRRGLQAFAGLAALEKTADLLLVIPNDLFVGGLRGWVDFPKVCRGGDALTLAVVRQLAALPAGAEPSVVHGAMAEVAAGVSLALPPLLVRPGFLQASTSLAPGLGGELGRTGLGPSL